MRTQFCVLIYINGSHWSGSEHHTWYLLTHSLYLQNKSHVCSVCSPELTSRSLQPKMHLPSTLSLFPKPQSSQSANMFFLWPSCLAPLPSAAISAFTCSYYQSSNVECTFSFVCLLHKTKSSMSYHKSIQWSLTGRMPLEVGQVHCIHSGQIFAWYMYQPNIKQNMTWIEKLTCKYKVTIENALFFSLPETPVEGPRHSKRHRSTAKGALCDNLFEFEMGRCRTKRSWCFQVQWTGENREQKSSLQGIALKKEEKLQWEQLTCPSIPNRMIMIKKHTDQSWGHGRRVTAWG